jgi:hypothetical protein
MERLPTWVTLFGLSIVIMAASVDQFSGERNGRENYIIATTVLSLIFSFFFITANLVDSLGNLVVGNVVENGKILVETYGFDECLTKYCLLSIVSCWSIFSLFFLLKFSCSFSNHNSFSFFVPFETLNEFEFCQLLT